MREADVAIWFGPPTQQDLVRRKLFTVHYHVYASTEFVKRYGKPKGLEDIDRHNILTYGGVLPEPIQGNELARNHGPRWQRPPGTCSSDQ